MTAISVLDISHSLRPSRVLRVAGVSAAHAPLPSGRGTAVCPRSERSTRVARREPRTESVRPLPVTKD